VAAVIAWIQVAAALFFVVLLVAVLKSGELHREDVRTYWRMKPFAWTGFVGIPALVVWEAVHGRLSRGDAVGFTLFWLLFAALLRWVSRPPARRDGAAGGTRTPS
jgi:hypothetical protein